MGIVLAFLLLMIIKGPSQAVLLRSLLALCIVMAFKSLEGGRSRVLGFVGKYAAIMYLIHVLFIVLLPKIVYYPRYSVLVFVLFAIACLAVAMLIELLERVTCYDKLRLSLISALSHI